MKMENNNYSILALVAIVAVVGVISLLMMSGSSNSFAVAPVDYSQDAGNLGGQALWVTNKPSVINDGILRCSGTCGLGGSEQNFGIQIETCIDCTCQNIGNVLCEGSSWIPTDSTDHLSYRLGMLSRK